MKKSNLLIVIAIIGSFLFSGCSTTALYDKTYVLNELDINKKKVDSEKVVIKNKETVDIGRSLSNSIFGTGPVFITMDVSTLNNQIVKEFFLQYFDNVEISDNTQDATFVVDSHISDYTLERIFFTDGFDLTIKLHVDVYKDDKKILSKVYDGKMDTGTLLNNNFKQGFHLRPIANIGYHKGLLWMYETMVKPDLLKALEDNI